MPRVVLPIKVAETGIVVNVELLNPYQDDSVVELQHMLASATGVAVEDQILLIGPPYKPLKRLDPPLVFSSVSRTDEEAEAELLHESTTAASSTMLSASSLASTYSEIGGGGGPTGNVTRSIYMYNRRKHIHINNGPPPPLPASDEMRLQDLLPGLPDAAPEPSPAWLQTLVNEAAGGGPLSQALSQYERLVSLNLAKGQAYVERGRRLLEVCVRCLEEQRVQRDAGNVALTNLRDHFGAIAREHCRRATEYEKQATKHQALLDNFNPNLRLLESRPLHPALSEALKESLLSRDAGGGRGHTSSSNNARHFLSSPSSSSASSSPGGGVPIPSGGGLDCEALRKATQGPSVVVTLLDCVPVGRVTDWFRECCHARERLTRWMDDLAAALGQLQEGVDAQRLTTLTVDLGTLAQQEIESLKRQLAEQEKALALLERGHQEVMDRIRTSYSSSSPSSSAKLVDTCQWLESVLTRQAGVMASLEGVDHDMVSQGKTLANQKTQTGRWLSTHLLTISRLQGSIQSLREELKIADQCMHTEKRHFEHLEHLEKLPAAYEALLVELTRRRAYARLFEMKVKKALDDVARFREREILARADFLKQHSSHLMPVFSQIFPTMQDRPPHFQAQALTPEQRLPVVRVADLLVLGAAEEKEGGAAGGAKGEEEDELLKGYVSCLAKAGGGGGGGGREEDGTGTQGGKEIMPGAEWAPTAEELEERCATQDLVIAQLKARLQTMALLQKQELDKKKKAAAAAAAGARKAGGGEEEEKGAGKEETVEAKLKRLEEENAAYRSCVTTVLSVMEDVRHRSSPSAHAQEEKKASSTSSSSSPSHQELVGVVSEISSLVKARLRDLELNLTTREQEVVALTDRLSPSSSTSLLPKISYKEFNVGDYALFLPTSHQGENRVYLAFHTSCPHRYLSHESLESVRTQHQGRFPDFILGKIVYIEEMVARDGDTASNPYHLQPGVKFYVLHVSCEDA